jgi:hypothetical protein
MPQPGFRVFLSLGACVFFFCPPLIAADAVTDPNQPQKVEVTNTPLEVTFGKNKTQVIVDIELEKDAVYQSSYLNVSEYRHASFFVTTVKELNSSISGSVFPAVYQLDAFYSTSSDESGYKNLETKETLYFYPGAQEFGSLMASGADGKTVSEHFIKTSTGETSTRVLSAPVFAPYVRLELRSRTPGEKRKFRISAYFSV